MGNGKDHCCYIKGKTCPLMVRNVIDGEGNFRKYACSLRIEHGNWDDVITDPRYIEVTKDAWVNGLNCRDWPDGKGPNKGICSDCGVHD
jgi:hypothetical protein